MGPGPCLDLLAPGCDGWGSLHRARIPHSPETVNGLAWSGADDPSGEAKVLVLSMQDDPRYVREAFAAGAAGYVLKEAADAEVVAAVHDLDLVLRHFDAVAVISGGGVYAHGTPETTLGPDLLERVFSVRGRIVPHPDTGRPHLLLSDAADPDLPPDPRETRSIP